MKQSLSPEWLPVTRLVEAGDVEYLEFNILVYWNINFLWGMQSCPAARRPAAPNSNILQLAVRDPSEPLDWKEQIEQKMKH